MGKLDLVQSRNHILKHAIAAPPEHGRQLLSTLALVEPFALWRFSQTPPGEISFRRA
ncbi:hypothetical protein [uncultured Thiodictyon sp.]|uniref:hypothetical protein n=1 Tax=uncultured Thiodictyon sp. TaxID=1846217 RepID=UPI0025F70ED0|nr:hypothetical protein [uncultured Thiodictyon sp.]